jgi:hypothetical protein
MITQVDYSIAKLDSNIAALNVNSKALTISSKQNSMTLERVDTTMIRMEQNLVNSIHEIKSDAVAIRHDIKSLNEAVTALVNRPNNIPLKTEDFNQLMENVQDPNTAWGEAFVDLKEVSNIPGITPEKFTNALISVTNALRTMSQGAANVLIVTMLSAILTMISAKTAFTTVTTSASVLSGVIGPRGALVVTTAVLYSLGDVIGANPLLKSAVLSMIDFEILRLTIEEMSIENGFDFDWRAYLTDNQAYVAGLGLQGASTVKNIAFALLRNNNPHPMLGGGGGGGFSPMGSNVVKGHLLRAKSRHNPLDYALVL